MSTAKTIRVGIMPLERIRDYTLAIAKGKGKYKRKPSEPKIWSSSIKSFAAILSDENLRPIVHEIWRKANLVGQARAVAAPARRSEVYASINTPMYQQC